MKSRTRSTARRAPRLEARALTLPRTALSDAPLADVLLYGLGLESDDPLEGVLAALRAEMSTAARLLESADADAANVVGSWARRLDVAAELHRRTTVGAFGSANRTETK